MNGDSDEAPRAASFGRHLARGAAWMLAMRWVIRLLGLVSTAALARLLAPSDFGIVAIAMLVAGLLDMAASAGVDLALIRLAKPEREHLDSAWTIQIIQGLLLAAMLGIAAPLAAAYYTEPRVGVVIAFLAVRAVIDGFANIGTFEFRSGLDFAREFRFQIYAKVLNVVALVAAALLLRSYLALAVGMVVTSVVTVGLSYGMHPFRPRLSTARMRELWSFSNWLLVLRLGGFLGNRADEFILSRSVGSTALGTYHVAMELATMPTTEVVMPMRRALFPTLAHVQAQGRSMEEPIVRAFASLAILCFATGFGLMAVAREAVALILGSQWSAAVPLVRILALYGTFAALLSILEVPLQVRGRARVAALQSWAQFVIIAPLIVLAVASRGSEGAALVRLVFAAVMLPVLLFVTARACAVRFAALLDALWRPFIAASTMIAVLGLPVPWPDLTLLALAAKAALGAATYAVALTLLWVAAGRPAGAEGDLLRRLARRDRTGERATL